MSTLVLRELNEGDEPAFLAACLDWEGHSPHWHSFVWKQGMSHREHLQMLADHKDKAKIAANRVPSTMLYAFVGPKIVGRLSVRHELNEELHHRGGHVGYAVCPSHRRKGYATEIFKQGLLFCHKLGLDKILVTCGEENEASWRVIEKFGGTLENKIYDQADSEMIRRYWVHTSS